jgi:hypothetical protein
MEEIRKKDFHGQEKRKKTFHGQGGNKKVDGNKKTTEHGKEKKEYLSDFNAHSPKMDEFSLKCLKRNQKDNKGRTVKIPEKKKDYDNFNYDSLELASEEKRNKNKSQGHDKMHDIKEGIVRIIPLGGVEEIGRNMYVVEYKNDIVILDAGFQFTDNDTTPGID